MRVSTNERDEVIRVLQFAFAEGMLDETEFDDRLQSATSAKTRGDLLPLTADIPESVLQTARNDESGTSERSSLQTPRKRGGGRSRFLFTYGSTIVREGRWEVPEKLRPIIFKGRARLDLRNATLPEGETAIRISGYKSEIELVVPAGVRVIVDASAYKGSVVDETARGSGSPVDNQITTAPDQSFRRRTVRVTGFGYKSRIIVRR